MTIVFVSPTLHLTSPSGSLSSTFCFKSKSISAYGPQGEGGSYLEGLRPFYTFASQSTYGLKPCLIRVIPLPMLYCVHPKERLRPPSSRAPTQTSCYSLFLFSFLVRPEFKQVGRAKGKVGFGEIYSGPRVKIRVFGTAKVCQQ